MNNTRPNAPILVINLVSSTIVFAIAAHLFVAPYLAAPKVIAGILLLHALRHLGLMFLSPGAVLPGMPRAFAKPAALGDALTAVLALVALPLVLGGSSLAPAALWIFNLVGTVDLITAIVLANANKAEPFMGAAYWIPAFWVPTLLVTHYLVFVALFHGLPLVGAA